jgi:excisionase family DNA binding protein
MKLMTINEAAEFLRISRSTIYKMVMNKSIPFIKLPGRLLFDQEELQNWLGQTKCPPIAKSNVRASQILKPRNRSD